MKKILVTTDFSDNAMAALRLAMIITLKGDYELTLLHVSHLLQPTQWNDRTFQLHVHKELGKTKKHLVAYAAKSNKEIAHASEKIKFAAINEHPVSKAIIAYAEQHHFDFICTATNGSGRFKRILGSVVSQLIKNSVVPLIIVPSGHSIQQPDSILWASDFFHMEDEIGQVSEFAQSIGASLGIFHHLGAQDFNIDPTLIRQLIKTKTDYPVELHLQETDLVKPLVEHIKKAVVEISPSLLIMFTDQNKTMLENILFPSTTKSFVYESPVPLVIFKK